VQAEKIIETERRRNGELENWRIGEKEKPVIARHNISAVAISANII